MTDSADDAELNFDLDRALSSLVSLRSTIPEDALTAPVLGTERAGNGVVIGDRGLVLTIGYLITEAESVWITDRGGAVVAGHVMGYDQETGLGIVQALAPMGAPVMELGDSDSVAVGDAVIVGGHGGEDAVIAAQVVAQREFAGYWEYVLDEAIFTAPAHPNWGGTAMIGTDGTLLGIGSLLVQTVSSSGESAGANMMVPINLLKPILEDLKTYGRPNRPGRPWMGMLVQDVGDNLVVANTYDDCPADRAGLQTGDLVLEVADSPVTELADFFRRVWALGPAGVEIPLTISRDGDTRGVVVESVDRYDQLHMGPIH